MFIEHPASKRSYNRRSSVHSFGINDADYIIGYMQDGVLVECPFYKKWRSMIKRCYAKESLIKNPKYKGCTVCDDWKLFTNFKKWMQTQHWVGKTLDKDLLCPGNKVYSPDKCIFVTHFINSLLVMDTAKNGIYPVGVSYNKKTKRFRACCSCNSERIDLGSFDTSEEASNEYLKYKKSFFIKTANKNKKDTALYNGLMKHISLILTRN